MVINTILTKTLISILMVPCWAQGTLSHSRHSFTIYSLNTRQSTLNLDKDSEKPTFNIYERLIKERIVFIGGPIDNQVANNVIATMLYLDDQDPDKDIFLYIDSPGGYVTAGMAIYDVIQHINSEVVTICVGLCASMGAFLLSAGTPGKRLALEHVRVMLHEPRGQANPDDIGQANPDDLLADLTAKEVARMRRTVYEILSQHTGQPIERLEQDLAQDFFMSAEEAQEYGVIDRIIYENENNGIIP